MRAVAGLILCCAAAWSAPTPADMRVAFEQAQFAWGTAVSYPVEFRSEPIGPCVIGRVNRADPEGSGTPVITTQVTDTQTSLSFDEGETTTVAHELAVIVRANSNCDWGRLDLAGLMIHEVGHMLIGTGYHSADRRSIMYPVVVMGGKQIIQPEDFRLLEQREEGESK